MRAAWLVGVVAIALMEACGSQSGDGDGGLGGSGGSASGGAGGTTAGQGGAGASHASGETGGNGGASATGSGAHPNITTSTSSPDAGTSAGTKPGATPDGGSPPTFTQLYNDILIVSCAGGACHDPGSQKGIAFASQSSAYSAVRNRVTPGNGEGSSFFFTVNSGTMPPGGPKLSAASLALIRAWIDAGALDD
jgi:hypothetical protein